MNPTNATILIETKRLVLRQLTVSDVNDQYLSWMNNPRIYQFLESKQGNQTISELRNFVSSTLEDSDTVFLAIIHREHNTHIGNIKLGPINTRHRNAALGFIIGEIDYWGKGYATEAISAICTFAAANFSLDQIYASCYSNNIGSKKSLLNSDFYEDGLNRGRVLFNDGTRKDILCFAYWTNSEGNR